MNVEKFLSFWTQHNSRIIEVLIVLILLMAVYIALRALFAKKDPETEASFDPTQLEKTLQKIIEGQKQQEGTREEKPTVVAATKETSAEVVSSGSEDSDKLRAEIENYKSQLVEKNKEIESLKVKLSEAATTTAAVAEVGAAPVAAAGLNENEKADYEAKIKDLETRLSEYEIIAEDIADLSKYKEENEVLKAEIEKLKGELANAATQAASGGGLPVDPVLDIPSDVAALMEKPTVEETEEVASAEAPVEQAEAAVSETAVSEEAVVAAEPAPVAAEEPVEVAASAVEEASAPAEDGLISDDLMKEFEDAVAQQKEAKAGPAPAANSEEMLDEFEKFVKKG